LRTAIVTALADNEVGRLCEDLILNGGVDTSWIRWVDYDGIGQAVRNGLNFTERGFGVRGALGVSDRGHTAAAQLEAGDIDWVDLFVDQGVRWFHTGGIYAGLSPRRPGSSKRPCPPPTTAAPSSPTTSTIGPASYAAAPR
jgi:2-dehydro-3-deoxygluconokinase